MKIVKVFLGLAWIGLLAGCTQMETERPEQEISLKIVVKDQVNDKELLDETITETGQIKTLYDFLEKAKELDVKFGEGSYGAYIDSILGLEQDFNKGPWWLYASQNNETCLKEGMCPAIQELDIQDGDQFEFTYTKEF